MNWNKVITFCFYKRPDYARQCIDAVRKAKGSEQYRLIFCLDGPPRKDMRTLCSGVTWAKVDIHQHGENIGCNRNTRFALRKGFAETDYVIHLEEDIVIGPDALILLEWYRQFYVNKKIWNVSLWRHPKGWLPGRGPFPAKWNTHQDISECDGMHIWGWATWKDRWEEMDEHWTTGDDTGPNQLSWDTCLTRYRKSTGRVCYVPMISRAINIGEKDGTHTGATILPYWSGSPGFKHTGAFRILNA